MNHEKIYVILMNIFYSLSMICLGLMISVLLCNVSNKALLENIILLGYIYFHIMYLLFRHLYEKNHKNVLDDPETKMFFIYTLALVWAINLPYSRRIDLTNKSDFRKAVKKFRKEFSDSFSDLHDYMVHNHSKLYINDGNESQEAYHKDVFFALVMLGYPYTLDNGDAYIRINRDDMERKKKKIEDIVEVLMLVDSIEEQNWFAEKLRDIIRADSV